MLLYSYIPIIKNRIIKAGEIPEDKVTLVKL